MKTVTRIWVAAALVIFAGARCVYAQDVNQQSQDHAAHHSDAKAAPQTDTKATAKTENTSMGDQNGMMESMKMDDVHRMMHECMQMHKDGKMCEHEAMEKCEANMKKADCQKMMKQTKARSKKASTKK